MKEKQEERAKRSLEIEEGEPCTYRNFRLPETLNSLEYEALHKAPIQPLKNTYETLRPKPQILDHG